MNGRNVPPRRPAGFEGDFMQVDSVWLGEPQQTLPFFKELGDVERQHPALVAIQKHYSGDATVFIKGNQPSNLYVLLSGVARVTETGPRGEGIQSTAFLAASLAFTDEASKPQ